MDVCFAHPKAAIITIALVGEGEIAIAMPEAEPHLSEVVDGREVVARPQEGVVSTIRGSGWVIHFLQLTRYRRRY